jgi:hypothetical protein
MRKIVLLLALFSSFTCWGGITYTAVTRTILGSKNQAGNMRVQAWVDGQHARMDFIESALPQLGSGTYLVSSDGGDTAYYVDPRSKTYERWEIANMIQNMADVMRAMRSQMKVHFEEPKVEKLLDEPGPRMHGFPTRHYRFRTSYTSHIEMYDTETISTEIDEDVWTTTAITEPGLMALLNKRPSSGDEQLDRIIQEEMDKVPGFPLKRITSTRMDSIKETTESRTEMQITELKSTPIAASWFEIPKGYKELDPEDSDINHAIDKLHKQHPEAQDK